MKNPFTPGDQKRFSVVVQEDSLARFGPQTVHPVYATFALARDAEWVCRLFVLDMKEEGEEGIGVFVSVEHLSPALPGETVAFVATLAAVEGNLVACTWEAHAGDRLIARGEQRQKIIQADRMKARLATLQERLA